MSHNENRLILWFEEVGKEDVPKVGGKSANLGELMTKAKVPVPPGFSVTTYAYKKFLEDTGIKDKVFKILEKTNTKDFQKLEETSNKIRQIIESTPIPEDIAKAIMNSYDELARRVKQKEPLVAVRSSASAEDKEWNEPFFLYCQAHLLQDSRRPI
ncbi:MAG: PEP/pyruvate-binding domain-containing protein [Candidatus Jordarchaeaceae archaeon]